MDRIDDLLRQLAAMPEFVASAFAGVPASDLTRGTAASPFSPVEHAWHLADLEREGYGVRLRRLLDEPHPHLADFDGDRIARERNYRALPLDEALAAFRAARAANLALLHALTPELASRAGTQEGVGRITLAEVPAMMAGHDAAHRAEIEAWLRETGRRP